MTHLLRRKLANHDLLLGTLLALPAPEIAEILSAAGFDWLLIDLEHSGLEVQMALWMLQAAVPSTECVVRVPTCEDEVWFKKCLDIGPSGILVPQIRSADDVRRVISWSKYPPSGRRSVGIGRAHQYGLRFKEYIEHSNDETAVILQIENADAVANIESITNVDGVDALFVGPYDLSASLGQPGELDQPEVRKAIERVTTAAQEAGIPLGIFGADAGAVAPFIASGFRLIAVGTDALFLVGGAHKVLSSLR